MKRLTLKKQAMYGALLSSVFTITFSSHSYAQTGDGTDGINEEDTIVVTGTRRAVGSAADVPSPVDIIPTSVLFQVSDTVGVRGTYPTEAFTATAFGNTYPVASPNGFNGGFYYSKLTFDF